MLEILERCWHLAWDAPWEDQHFSLCDWRRSIPVCFASYFKGNGYTWYSNAISFKGDSFCDFLFAFLYTKSFLKGVYSKRKVIAPKVSKLFPLTLKVPSKICSRQHSNNFFFIFQRKQVLTFHVNCLLGRQFTWNVKTCFLCKKKKKDCRLLQLWLAV